MVPENDFSRYWIPNTGLQTKEEGPEKEAGHRLTTGIVMGGGGVQRGDGAEGGGGC